MNKVVIKAYDPVYQQGINQMMSIIEAEFKEAITGSQSTKINDVYLMPGQKFWVALYKEEVVGTIGIVINDRSFGEVKRMMVHPQFRGSVYDTANKLLKTGFGWIREQNIDTVYLGTMNQFKAAQRFYEKKGFVSVSLAELPSTYTINPIDTLFYTLILR